ncbi:MAG TPA: RNA-binding S4 domain-containing protein [Bacteroidales bacterium]|nr:RNA-binding S4 domain-containing protein [Bacteroidales bacterium]
MQNPNEIRIDKFLWAARIYKTRSIATEECKKGRILINNAEVKPSRSVSVNEIIIVRKPPVTYTFRVLQPAGNRVSAKLVPTLIEDLTPEEEKTKLDIHHPSPGGYRPRGTGRPTKKERRLIDRLRDDIDGDEGW